MWQPKKAKGDENDDPNEHSSEIHSSLSALKKSSKDASILKNGAIAAEAVEEEELHITQTDLFKQQSIRNAWKPGSAVEIYSESQAKWNQGKITKIFNDDEGEWLVIKYAGSTKEIQRFNECIRPPTTGNNNGKKSSTKKTLKPSKQQKKLTDLKEIIGMSIKASSNGSNGSAMTKKNGIDKIPATLSQQKRASTTDIINNAEPISNDEPNVVQETEEKIQENVSNTTNGTNGTNGSQNGSKNPWEYPCPHGDATIDELQNMKLKNRRVCAVRGLPSFATEKLLCMNEWYGQFKGMKKINIDKNKPKAMHETDSILAYITFDNEKSVQDAINFSNNATFGDGRKLKAAFGIQYYCRNFLAKSKCELPYCRYKHQWVKDLNDVITPAEMDKFKAKDCGLSLNADSYITQNMTGLNSMTPVSNVMSPITPLTTPIAQQQAAISMQQQQLYQQQQKYQQQQAALAQKRAMKQQMQQQQQANTKPVDTDKLQRLVNEKLKIKQENDRLRKENSQYQVKIAKLNMDYKALHAENQKMKGLRIENKKYKMDQEKLMEEHKELQSKYEELEKKYKAAIQQNKNWDEWNGDDVVNWIVGLDEANYGKYRSELSKNVAAEGIDGNCLADLERNDLHRIGISQFKDKKAVYNAIQELVNSDKQ